MKRVRGGGGLADERGRSRVAGVGEVLGGLVEVRGATPDGGGVHGEAYVGRVFGGIGRHGDGGCSV